MCFDPVTPNCQASCAARLLTKQDAQVLLGVIPQALAAKRIGGKVSIVDWSPGADFRSDMYYFYEVLSSRSTDTIPLGNGVIGYFGVNKFNGQVVELNSDRAAVKGEELKRLQSRLRAKYCISRARELKFGNVPLER